MRFFAKDRVTLYRHHDATRHEQPGLSTFIIL